MIWGQKGENILGCNARAASKGIEAHSFTKKEFADGATDSGTVRDRCDLGSFFEMPFHAAKESFSPNNHRSQTIGSRRDVRAIQLSEYFVEERDTCYNSLGIIVSVNIYIVLAADSPNDYSNLAKLRLQRRVSTSTTEEAQSMPNPIETLLRRGPYQAE